jgi:methionyl-tRNA formyltransferase
MQMKYKQGIIIGTSNLAFQCAELLRQNLPVTVFENDTSRFSVLTKKCKKAGIECSVDDKVTIMTYLANVDEPTIVFSVINTYLFSKNVVNKPELTIINYHNALLPKFPGRNAEAWVIYEGERETGYTWHYIDESIDGGYMIAQKKFDITPTTTAGEIFNKMNETAFDTFREILPDCLNNIARKAKLNTKRADVKYSHDVPGDGILDMSWSFEQTSRFLRAMDFGGFPQFPKPKIAIDGNTYCWRTYSLFPDEKATVLSHSRDGKDIILSFPDGKVILHSVTPPE